MGFLRIAVERASRDRILKRKLPVDLGGGTLFVSPDAGLRFLKPKLESDLFDLAREFVNPGDTVWDVGANVGIFSAAAAHRAGPAGVVIAIEADIWLASLLRRTSAALGAGNAQLQVIPAAIANDCSIAEFNIAKRSRACNFLATSKGSSQAGGVRETVQVVTVTLDWLLQQQGMRPAVLKVDVEGAEKTVFEGAALLLDQARPIIHCEVQDASREWMTALFHRHGYKLYDWSANPRLPADQASFNTLALPRH